MPSPLALSGQRFGSLVVVRSAGHRRRGVRLWACRCDCGSSSIVATSDLRSGHTTSCGCVQRRRAAVVGLRNRRHGLTRSPEYRAWANMIDRCENPSNARFADWGGRGITVCPRWRASFEAFLSDVGLRPSPSHSLDREDNEGIYEPGNCRWATAAQQVANRRPQRARTMLAVTPESLDVSQ